MCSRGDVWTFGCIGVFFWFWFCFVFHFFLRPVCQGALEEQLALSGDGAYNAHFGESIASLGDLDDDGFPGQ